MSSERVRGVSRLLPLVLAAIALAAGSGAPARTKIEYGRGRKLCNLANTAITESSGLACSWFKRGVFWTHNDSGDTARIFAFNMQGEDLATYEIKKAGAVDWEDMASCRFGDKSVLLFADVGDNQGRRETCTLYVVVEPLIDKTKRNATGTVKPALTIRFRYEDGPHNCEAVAVDPKTRTIYLVTKAGAAECKVYALPWPKQERKKPFVAKAVADLHIAAATAMDISPDGLRAIVLTYGPAYEFTKRPNEQWSDAFARAPRLIRMPPRAQGESICYGQDGKTLYLTSEKVPTPLLEIPVLQPD